MARLLLVSCLVACCAALQPSLILSARTAQAAQRTAAPVMKRPDYFLRVSRSEAGRPRLCVFRCAVATTNPRWIGRLALIGCLHPWLCASHTDAQQQLSFPPAGRPHRLPPPSQLQPRPSQRTPVQPSGRPAHKHSQPFPPSHAQHIPAHQRTRERRTCRASALLPLESTSRALSRWPGGARRSNKNIYAQIIDDSKGVVLCSASTKEKGMDAATANGAPYALTIRPYHTPSSTNPTPNPSPEERGMGAATANGS